MRNDLTKERWKDVLYFLQIMWKEAAVLVLTVLLRAFAGKSFIRPTLFEETAVMNVKRLKFV